MVSNQTINNPANDEQFWQTVERVATQVVTSARGEAPGGPKGFAPNAEQATSPPASQSNGEAAGQRPGRVTAPPTGGTAAGNRGNGQAPPQRMPSGTDAAEGDQPSPGTEQLGNSSVPGIAVGEGADQGEQKWIGAALSLAATVAPMVIDAFRKRRKDFMPDGADGHEKLMSAVADAITPAIIDAVASRPKDFTLDLPPDASGEDGAEGDFEIPMGRGGARCGIGGAEPCGRARQAQGPCAGRRGRARWGRGRPAVGYGGRSCCPSRDRRDGAPTQGHWRHDARRIRRDRG